MTIFQTSDPDCSECPITYVTPTTRHWIYTERQQDILKESTGACLYGPDISKWPSKMVDVFTTIASCKNEYDYRKHETEMSIRG